MSKYKSFAPDVSVQRLRELLHYDPSTGVFTRRVRVGKHRAGEVAGSRTSPQGYCTIWIDRKGYRAHRLAWLNAHGCFPSGILDHINGDRGDNRLCNIRVATASQNMANRKANANSRLGVKGVRFRPKVGKFEVRIQVAKVPRIIGYFPTLDDAKAAYAKAARAGFGKFARPA